MAVFSSVLIDLVFWGLFYELLWDFEFDYFSDCLRVHRVGVFQMIMVLDFSAYRVIVAELLFTDVKKPYQILFGEKMGFFYRLQHTVDTVLNPNPYIVYFDYRSIAV